MNHPDSRSEVTRSWVRNDSDLMAIREGCYFDPKAAERVRKFFTYLKPSKGQTAGKPIELQDWQYNEIVGPLFGWKRKDGTRRFRMSFNFVAKKNGKSLLSSGIALYLLLADFEPGAEVYCLAGDRNQASIVFNECVAFVESSEELEAMLRIVPSTKVINFDELKGFIKAVSADAKTKEGFNIHGCICDETHTWPRDNKLWNAVKYGGASRTQPLFVHITTAGEERSGLWWNMLEYTKLVNSGKVDDIAHHGVIYETDERDDPDDEATWYKANPALGKTLSLDNFKEDHKRAKMDRADWAVFLRYRLNRVAENTFNYFDMELWDQCPQKLKYEDLAGQKCFAGFDLATTTDLCSFSLWFPKFRAVIPFYIVPEERLITRVRENKHRLDKWVEDKWIYACEGSYVRLKFVKELFKRVVSQYKLLGIGVDPWYSHGLYEQLQAELGIEVFTVTQTARFLTAPMKYLNSLIYSRRLQHFNNPVFRWNAANTVASVDPNENVRPMKNRSPEKIDGVCATLNAMAFKFTAIPEVAKESIYEERGLNVDA